MNPPEFSCQFKKIDFCRNFGFSYYKNVIWINSVSYMLELKDVILQLVMYFCVVSYFFTAWYTSFWSDLFERQSFSPNKKVELKVLKCCWFVGSFFCLFLLGLVYRVFSSPWWTFLDITFTEVQFWFFVAGVAVLAFILCVLSTLNIHFEKRWKWEDLTFLNMITFLEDSWKWLKKELLQLLRKKKNRKKD